MNKQVGDHDGDHDGDHGVIHGDAHDGARYDETFSIVERIMNALLPKLR